MKKFGLLCLAVVLALGTLGVGYALWFEDLYISGTVQTGEVDWEFVETINEVGGVSPGDYNYTGWVYTGNPWSCPPGYEFTGIHSEVKDVAYPIITPTDTDGDGDWDTLVVTIHNAYPYYLCDISFHIHNNGSVPIHICEPEIVQDYGLLVEFEDNIGDQVHPCSGREMSFYVGVIQDTVQEGTYTFSITLQAVQYNEPCQTPPY